MRCASLVVLDTDLSTVTAQLGRLGVLQLFDVRALGGWADRLSWGQAAVLARAYDDLWRRLTGLLEALGLPAETVSESGERIPISPDAVLAEAQAALAPIAQMADQILKRRRAAEREVERLDVVARQLELLRPVGVDLDELRQLRYLAIASGLVPAVSLERLRGSLEAIPHVIIPITRVGDHVLVLAAVARWDQDVLDRALRSAYVERVEIPSGLRGRPEDALRDVANRREELAREINQATADLTSLGRAHRSALVRTRDAVSANRLAVDAWRQVGQTAHTRLLTGWVPAPQAMELRSQVEAATSGRALVQLAPSQPQTRREVEHPGEPSVSLEPPVELSNPPALRPFESLVTTYGLPRYDELDPTPLAAGLFLVMFGMMFGDLGQGAVLAVIGLLIARRIIPFGGRNSGIVLASAGLSAMLFGLLYGSAFGSEQIIPALWFHPLRNATFFLQIAVGFGIAVVTTGLLLHILKARRSGDYLSLFLDQHGVVGLWLYWGILVAVGLALLNRPPGLAELIALVGVPLALLYLRGPLEARLGLAAPEEAPGEVGSTYYVVSGVEVFDVLVRYVSNTVSFLRLAAFALSHAGLGVVVFTLAAMARGVPFGAPAVLVLGNAVVVGLEGLIVAIQALRLQYYEFFSKFYQGGGKPYRPFALPLAAGSAGAGPGEEPRAGA